MTMQAGDSDYFLLDELLTDEERAVRDRVREWARARVLPTINARWEAAEFPSDLLPGLAELGVVGTVIQGWGCPGMSRKAAGMVARELSRVDGSINTFFGVHSSLGMGSIYLLGDDEQRGRWLPAMARLEQTGAFALTEPRHGSDSVALETSARRDGDAWVLNGHKRWIGNGEAADVVVVFARDEHDARVKAFVVEKDQDGQHPRGYRPELIRGKVGKRAIQQADIVIQDLRVPAENRLVNGESFTDVNRVLRATRGGAAWESVGHAMAAFEIAADYARTREQFGRPIGATALVQDRLTDAQASLVKMTTARQGLAICREARDMLGGNGLLLEHHVARRLTDMEVVSTYEGTDSVQALIVGRDATGLSAFR